MAKTKRTHFQLLCDIGELAHLLADTADIGMFLEQTVDLVARHLHADVCSIYLYNEKEDALVLKATQGLNVNAVDVVKLKVGEGLVGISFEAYAVINDGNAQDNPNFKYFAEADEDKFHSFICVPIRRGDEKIGAMVVQHGERNWFDDDDVRALKAAASQLAGSLENVRLLMAVSQSDTSGSNGALQETRVSLDGRLINGTSAAAGYAFGKSLVMKKSRSVLLRRKSNGGKRHTKADFEQALERTIKELQLLQEGFAKRLPESASLIFTAHFMMLKDKSFSGEMARLIDTGIDPVEAVKTVASEYIALFMESPHAYMQEKALDVEDLALRILSNMLDEATTEIRPKRVFIASELFPSDVLKLASGEVLGIVLVGGGIASHVAILCRSLQIPLVIADEPALLELPPRTPVLLDANVGNIYVNPGQETISLFEQQQEAHKSAGAKAAWMSEHTETADGTAVTLLANINLLSEVSLAQKLKSEGIGLYRTEFPFLIRTTFPSEAEQYVIYKRLFDSMPDKTVTIRTLDAGGDKALAYSNVQTEVNPELGLRSIRFLLRHRDVFENQIRAILRAATGHPDAQMMFPLISSLDELREAKQMVEHCKEALRKEDVEFHGDMKIGMMIELPAVLGILDLFAAEVDFFSVGTNDFVQYMLAADRTSKLVSEYYAMHHPSVLRGLAHIATSAKSAGIPVSICGEMAREPRFLPFLLGIGIRKLSIDPQFLPVVQQQISKLTIEDANAFAARLLKVGSLQETSAEIERMSQAI
ncbi:MAG: phosphoenolpyruvate--protein phosphotransferase [Deltaproteobacteria bacterium]|nr:phosphoenolpyruvate--protein phosphotransferase [Deltaproteobacteria bacterium]MBN2670581.1 phosphoenolpyruvate--protein phosphotransferase [Deltaproteobacteria bacterium]